VDNVMLFAKPDLGSALEATTKKVADRLQAWNPDALLAAPEADVIEELIGEGTVRCPELLRADAWMPPPSEAKQMWRGIDGPVERRVPQLVLVVPFEGERAVFLLRAGRSSWNPPRILKLNDHELHIAIEEPGPDPAAVRANFDAQLDKIEQQLAWSREQVEGHNAQIRSSVPRMVADRRRKLLAIRGMQAEIGFPIRRRPDADTYAVPIKRRTLRPVRPTHTSAAQPFKPEPAMAEADYRAALTVLRASRNALERTPEVAAKLGEEEIRDLLLVNLNAQFEGDAAGELFNGEGKTDILIRVADRNIFIGECKIWDGVKTIEEALGQTFKYLVWRDTKAAILLFIRNRDVTAVIAKAVEAIEKHASYKRRGAADSDEQVDFVMHATGDPQREIHLALLPFALRANATPRPAQRAASASKSR
jgi:hypothetical protein